MFPNRLQILLKFESVFLDLNIVALAQLLEDGLPCYWLFCYVLIDLRDISCEDQSHVLQPSKKQLHSSLILFGLKFFLVNRV